MIVPLNTATDITNLPVALFASSSFATMTQTGDFIPNCLICKETFETSEQSSAHFQSEDHETAQVSFCVTLNCTTFFTFQSYAFWHYNFLVKILVILSAKFSGQSW